MNVESSELPAGSSKIGIALIRNEYAPAQKNRFRDFVRRAVARQETLIPKVPRLVILLVLLPLSVVSAFGSLTVAASRYRIGYDWQATVMSRLTSPIFNRHGWWLPALGIMVSMLLTLPFAGYMTRSLQAIDRRVAQWTGLAFALSAEFMFVSLAVQMTERLIGQRWLHTWLAHFSGFFFVVGMIGCCICALKDRKQACRRKSLPPALTVFWITLCLVPIIILSTIGALRILGELLNLMWVENFRQSFRTTPIWHLAFWEWIATAFAYAFVTGSVLFLPVAVAPEPLLEEAPAGCCTPRRGRVHESAAKSR